MTEDASTACVFCRILRGDLTPGVVAFRDSKTAVFPSRAQQPRNQGHFAGDGFTGLAGSLGAVELPLEERMEQARRLSQALEKISARAG